MLSLPLLLLLSGISAACCRCSTCRSRKRPIQYTGTSVYLAVAALLFACLFANNTMTRLATMRIAYVLSATHAALAGSPDISASSPAPTLFAPYDRALGAFKDPNVFGPFLIWPTLFIVERMLTRHIGIRDLVMSRDPAVRTAAELFARRLVSFRRVAGVVVALAF